MLSITELVPEPEREALKLEASESGSEGNADEDSIAHTVHARDDEELCTFGAEERAGGCRGGAHTCCRSGLKAGDQWIGTPASRLQ